jgi:GGDEF domain-containing protein
MRAQRKLLRELVTHDGLKDSLTGLLSLPAFLESAKRELHSAERNGANLILYLVSITEINDAGKRAHIVRADREITEQSDDELYSLAARIVEISHALTHQLRANDLIARYTFAEFLIMNSGDTSEITKKLREIVDNFGAMVIGIEMVRIGSKRTTQSFAADLITADEIPPGKKNQQLSVESAISLLEEEMAALIISGYASTE